MELVSWLQERFPCAEIERDFSFARHTTIGCGGCAAAAISPRDTAQTASIIRCLQREAVPFCFLGAGANSLPSDGFFEGVVVRFRFLNGLSSNGETVIAGAGVTGGELCRFAWKNGLGGLEPLTGIPMTVGGAVVMNAGVAEGHISDFLDHVVCVDRGEIRILQKKNCLFGEKTSVFQNKIAVTEVCFRLIRRPIEKIQENMRFFSEKRALLPKGRSMGCTFVNPKECSAGKLIDECGLKGLRCGGAYVSDRHANFILNDGGTAEDVKRLIQTIKHTVARKTGILLREEIRYLPDT